jgi:DNA repair exonuclease SbcCD nuclease subunit
MKVAICSDIHLEFGDITLENTENADVLILSGDICVSNDLRVKDDYEVKNVTDKNAQYHKFFKGCCERFNRVIYIMGNHEYYHGDFGKSLADIRDRLRYLDNLHILEKETVEIGDCMFFGATLWTDMNKEDPRTLMHIKGYMNDYRIIQDSTELVQYKVPVYEEDENGNRNIAGTKFHTKTGKFTPEKSVSEHKETLRALKESIASKPDAKWIVVGHHAPSKLSTKPQYEDDVIVNGAYSSDLSEFILDHTQIKLWTHGHTHHNFDYMVGDTRVVANPRGYIGYEHQADIFNLKFVEV